MIQQQIDCVCVSVVCVCYWSLLGGQLHSVCEREKVCERESVRENETERERRRERE